MMGKSGISHKLNLQHVLDYFEVLKEYVQNGFLEVSPSTGESYITESAFYTLALYDDKSLAEAMGKVIRHKFVPIEKRARIWKEMRRTAFWIRTYSDYLGEAWAEYEKYMDSVAEAPDHPYTRQADIRANEKTGVRDRNIGKSLKTRRCFAVHVVDDNSSHDLDYSILIEKKRCWWWPWRMKDCYSVVVY